MAHDVFISYSSKDKPIADGVCANLESADVRCWIAPRDIAAGEDWPAAISRAISKSRIMVLIFSANSNSSEDVGRELMLAANSKLVIIPFKIENVEPEPGKQYYLARTHWLDAMNPPTRGQISTLVDRVKSILPAIGPDDSHRVESDGELHPKPSPGPAIKGRSSWPWLAWIAGTVVLAGLAAWVASIRTVEQVITPTEPTTVVMSPVPSSTLAPGVLSASSGTLFMDDFNDASFDGALDSGKWVLLSGKGITTIQQMNGYMVASKPTMSGMEAGGIGTNERWSLREFTFIEGRLMLDKEHAGVNGNVALTLSDKKAWWAGCGIQVGDPTPFFWCGQGAESGFEYMSDSYYVDYDKWYTVRLEYNPQSEEFIGFIDGMQFYSWQSYNIDELALKSFIVAAGTWADDGTIITGYVDDVRVEK